MIIKPSRGLESILLRVLLVIFGSHGTSSVIAQAATPPNVVRWNIEATVIEVADPDGAFPDVRTGDPVRGVLRYDASLTHYFHLRTIAFYTHDVPIEVVTMLIENPRMGSEMRFSAAPNAFYRDVDVANDTDFVPDSGPLDYLYAVQGVLPPAGYMGPDPVVDLELYGSIEVLASVELPTTLNLDDWPVARISFSDYSTEERRIVAEINSLQLVTTIPLPADFDHDDDVDGQDLLVWNINMGSSSMLYADADADLDVDGADFLAWQRNLTAAASRSSAFNAVEPASPPLVVAACAVVLGSRRHFHRLSRPSWHRCRGPG